tara:strand:+ start:116 stop:979 length:864 start_codon:yes stop_codon:yes gene_type:complete
MTAVVLRCYDLSQGMAAAMSRQLLGRHIEAIYHTGVLVFGREYFFQGGVGSTNGITSATVREVEAQFGMRALKTVPLGETSKTKAEWLAFVRTVGATRFRHDAYSLLDNNCNNFSDEAAKFLLSGRGIPTEITGLPREILNGPLGGMLRPMMERMSMGGGGGGGGPLTGGGGGGGSGGGGFSPFVAATATAAAAGDDDLVDFAALMADDAPAVAAAAAAPAARAAPAAAAPATRAPDVLREVVDPPALAAALAQLALMGFADDAARRSAMAAANNDVSLAIALLVAP